eukprot:403167-Rhodomonas_salina.3
MEDCAMPAPRAACRAGACPTPALQTFPMIASCVAMSKGLSVEKETKLGSERERERERCGTWTYSGGIPAFSIAPWSQLNLSHDRILHSKCGGSYSDGDGAELWTLEG